MSAHILGGQVEKHPNAFLITLNQAMVRAQWNMVCDGLVDHLDLVWESKEKCILENELRVSLDSAHNQLIQNESTEAYWVWSNPPFRVFFLGYPVQGVREKKT